MAKAMSNAVRQQFQTSCDTGAGVRLSAFDRAYRQRTAASAQESQSELPNAAGRIVSFVIGTTALALVLPLLSHHEPFPPSDLLVFKTAEGRLQEMASEPAASIAIWKRGLERDWTSVEILKTNRLPSGRDTFYYEITCRVNARRHLKR